MDIYLEFIKNHTLLFIGFAVILLMLIQTIYSDLTRKFKLVTPSQTIDMINREDAVVIDTRSESEYNAGHINNAVFVPLAEIKQNPQKFKKYGELPLIFYCKTGIRSDDACKTLYANGFTNIHSLSGGIQAWQDAKIPLEKK